MKLILNILKWTALGIVVAIIVLFSISLFIQNNVADIFFKSLNKHISTRIEIGSSKLSLISKFPKAALELEDVLVHSSPTFDKEDFIGISTDTLLSAKSVSLEFRMIDLIKGNYNIESINISRGMLNLFSDSSGKVNYEISADTTSVPGQNFIIDLNKITISDLKTNYLNTAISLSINGLVKNGRLKSRIVRDIIDFTCNTDIQMYNFALYNTHLKINTSTQFDVNLHKSDSGFLFKKGVLKIENFLFDLSGYITSGDHMDLKISGRNIDLSKIKNYIPQRYLEQFIEYDPSGILKINCRLAGPLSRTKNPNIELSYSLESGKVHYKKSNININDLSFNGHFTNGKLNLPETSELIINDIKGKLGTAQYSGLLSISNFNHPKIDLTFSGDIISKELLEFINLPEVSGADGSLRLNLKLSGDFKSKDKYTLSDFTDFNPVVDISFNSFGIEMKNKKLAISDVDGNIMFARHLWADDLFFSYKGQRFRINGEFKNLPAWLAGKPEYIKATASVTVSNLMPEIFLPDSADLQHNKKSAFKLPSGLDLDISFKIDNLKYKTFSAENIKGEFSYTPGLANFNSLSINSLNGNISGNCIIAQNLDKSFMTKGNFTLNDINVKEAFVSFRNFGQEFIKAENINGSLTGTLSLLMPLDSLLHPVIKSITAEGKYILTDGALINFDPVKSLSRFIELSELENITFSKLENDFFIRSNYLAIPQMDIKSSAADLTVSGRHEFDNDYEYHVKMYLSELLSKKAKKSTANSSEFGSVEEDGLGRTSLFLKITGKGEDIKVGYDIKAASGNIKQNLRSEKGNLKNILNQEYGWYKKDTTIRQEPALKPKFRIVWDETDSTKVRPDSSTAEKKKGIMRIFKKKKNS
jgi:hypothetical protein